jgi:uncharacterized membrane protein
VLQGVLSCDCVAVVFGVEESSGLAGVFGLRSSGLRGLSLVFGVAVVFGVVLCVFGCVCFVVGFWCVFGVVVWVGVFCGVCGACVGFERLFEGLG